MSFWQYLADSYDQNAEALKKTYPLSTTSISNKSGIIAIIVIDGDGKLVRYDKIEKANHEIGIENITIPVTEKSLGRSSGVAPHPVFDQYGYLQGVGKKYDAYISLLKNFAESNFTTEQVSSIYKYIAKGTVADDLSTMKPKDKTNIVFQVEIEGCPQTKVWEDEAFFSAWHQYYLGTKRAAVEKKKQIASELSERNLASKEKKDLSTEKKKGLRKEIKELNKIDKELKDAKLLDYISGEDQLVAVSHPKKISTRKAANAKLVSDNDKANYTFRGKFSESSEAVSIGYETSQKAHQFLRYLINDRGHYCGEQVILSFAVGSTEKLLPPPIEEKNIWSILQESQTETESDAQINLRAETGVDYADALRKSLAGFGHSKALGQHAKTVVLALDAATTGRLAITFYRELDKSEYLEKVAEWHSGCKWHQKFWSKEKEKYVPYIGAPSIDRIIEAVYGKPHSGKDESYTKIKKVARERLLRCVFDGVFLPTDYVTASVRRASNPLGITKNSKFDRNGFEQVVSTTCALVRKEYLQKNKEDYTLSVELDRTDRDYLYGRLLGAADKLEEYALYKKDNDRVVTAAIRHMQTFAQHPFRTWQTIHGCLNPYIQAVKGSFAFNEIQAVMAKFLSGDYEKDASLNGSYLIGYYHERAYIDSLVEAAKNKQKGEQR
ncbi:MAG: type I-C CRISPR-associated protein Cas8c/Csd1 [Desulfuromusa sp.]|nr:type I-C CRISPR-associated protein Cas8c/Csd1 [Desulfuromusa sp.]